MNEGKPPALPGASARLAIVDALRGAALIGMFVYHFSWDLLFFHLIGVDVGEDPAWRSFAHVIAASFLALAGIGLTLAHRQGFRREAFFRRFFRIAFAAAAISLVSFLLATALGVPDLFIYFGILHAVALASLVAVPFLFAPAALVMLAALLCLLAPSFIGSSFFENSLWWWLGLSQFVASTVDYVPLLPWCGATLIGLLLGRAILAHAASPLLAWTPRSRLGALLVLGGRWSLAIYLAHQPILFGFAFVLSQVIG